MTVDLNLAEIEQLLDLLKKRVQGLQNSLQYIAEFELDPEAQIVPHMEEQLLMAMLAQAKLTNAQTFERLKK